MGGPGGSSRTVGYVDTGSAWSSEALSVPDRTGCIHLDASLDHGVASGAFPWRRARPYRLAAAVSWAGRTFSTHNRRKNLLITLSKLTECPKGCTLQFLF